MKALLARAALTAGLLAASYAIALGARGELVNTAPLDSAGTLRIWWGVVGEWNNFLWPRLVVNDAATLMLPLQLGKMAGSLLASLPTVLLFPLFQKQFVAGLQAGATKG